MAAIIIAVWIVGYIGSETPGGPDSPKRLLINIHKSVAIAVLALVVVRLVWRALHAPPPLSSGSALVRFIAGAGHWLLYLLMIAMPLTGWAWASSGGRPVEFLGLFELPRLLAPNEAAKSFLGETHRTLAWVTAVVIVGHVLAAIKHWLIDKDDVLQSMLSRRR
ncbi:MAG: cytochrome b [Steroidobacter sp.]|nr:cytochrome b [Steroidobacter sp.]